jgi:O-antigen/teichoic acid export membrane protein
MHPSPKRVSLLQHVARGGIVKQAAIVFASSMLVNACNYLFHLLNSRRLGVEGYGVLASMIALLSLATVSSTIFQLVVAKTGAELYAAEDGPRLRRLATLVMRLSGISFVVILIVGALCGHLVGAFLQVADVPTVMLTVSSIAVALVFPGPRGYFQAIHDFRALAISTSLEAVGRVGLGVALVYAGFGVRGALVGATLGPLLGLAYTFAVMVRARAGEHAALKPDLRRLLQTLGGTTASTVAIGMLSFADVLLVKHLFDADQSGLYSALSLVGRILLFAVGFLPTVVLPTAVARASSGRDPTPLLVQAGALALAVSGAGVVLCVLFPGLVLHLIAGAAFVPAAALLPPYAAAMAMLGLANVAIVYKIGLHRFDFVLPTCAIAIAEIVGFAVFHGSLWAIVRTLFIGHTLVFLTSLRGIRAPLAAVVAVPQQAEVA